jgi:acyl dehydratase
MPRFFEDYQVGDEVVTPARTIFEADVVNFFYLSGDQNESHSNIEVSRARGVPGPAVQWNLVFSLVAGLLSRSAFYNGVGPILAHERARESAWKPGTDPVLGRHEGTLLEPKQGVAYRGFQFVNLKPVRVGDTIHAHVRVGAKLELGPEKRAVIRRDVRVFNQKGELVQEGWHEMESPRKPG